MSTPHPYTQIAPVPAAPAYVPTIPVPQVHPAAVGIPQQPITPIVQAAAAHVAQSSPESEYRNSLLGPWFGMIVVFTLLWMYLNNDWSVIDLASNTHYWLYIAFFGGVVAPLLTYALMGDMKTHSHQKLIEWLQAYDRQHGLA